VKYTNLLVIKYAANNVKDLSEIAVLKDLKNLKNLDLGDNPVTETEGYREKVLEMFPDLLVLDNTTRDGNEYISEDDEDDYDDEEEGEGEAPEGADDEDDEFEDDEEGEGDYDDEYGDEEGEDDGGEDEESAELGKRKK
jgi:hypothetical protein